MALEIEKKFLVRGDAWRAASSSTLLRQGYLSTDPDRTVRVRVDDGRGWLTIKGRAQGDCRLELEYEIPTPDAETLLGLVVGSILEKRRHRLELGGFHWEVDEFLGDCSGLVVAELEVHDPADFARALAAPPAWLGPEVTDDRRLSNARLAERPFARWSAEERAALAAGG